MRLCTLILQHVLSFPYLGLTMFLPFRGHPLPRTILLSLILWSAPTQPLSDSSVLSLLWVTTIIYESFDFPYLWPFPWFDNSGKQWDFLLPEKKISELPLQWQRWFCSSLNLQHTIVSSGCSNNLKRVNIDSCEWGRKISQDCSRLYVLCYRKPWW